MIDKHTIDDLMSLDDKELKARINAAAKAAGADESKITAALSDMNTVRRLASSLTPEIIDSLIKTFGEENAKKAADTLNKDA